MQELPAPTGNSGDTAATAHPQLQQQLQEQQQPPQSHVNGGGDGDGDGGSIGGGFTEDGDRNSSGNRWPKQETLALIKIRSEMDATFRDSNLKGPLWDNVSRKLAELGFHRSAKKCREKFENVYKYHRRTKEGRTSKSDKIYRFSDQLQALESNPRGAFSPPPLAAAKPPPVLVAMGNNNVVAPSPFSVTGSDQNNVSPISVAAPAVMTVLPAQQPVMNHHKRSFPFSNSQPNVSESTNSASSSDTFSDEEPPPKKRKWKDFFGKLMKEVIEKQEELQRKFLDTLERRERDRVAKEEAWRAQEIAKMNQEHERLVQERSIAAAKDAAVITFLQKMMGKNLDSGNLFGDGAKEKLAEILAPPVPPTIPVLQAQAQAQAQPQPQPQVQQIYQPSPPPPPAHHTPPPSYRDIPPAAILSPVVKNLDGGSGGENMLSPSPSRWPKAEINALITLRTQLDIKYQENVPKGPLWEEISAAMRRLGYNRNAKRCKEKWENINKYYKKMKDSNKKRSEASKTCPYYDQLDAIYNERANGNKMAPIVAQPEQQWPPAPIVQEKALPPQEKTDNNLGFGTKPETQIATPVVSWPQEQQWRPSAVVQEPPKQPPQSTAGMDDQGSENLDDYDDDDDDEDGDDDEKEEEDGGYEIVPNKMSSMAAV